MHDDDVIEGQAVAIVPVPQAPIMSMEALSTDRGLEAATVAAQNAIEFRNRCVRIALAGASAADVLDMEGKPYVGEALCEQVFGILGGTIRKVSCDMERDDEGVGCEYSVEVSHPMFGVTSGVGYFHESEIRAAAMKRMTKHLVRTRARTRAVGGAVRKMLGLASLTWEQLEALGYKRGGGGSVKFNSKPRNDAPAASSAMKSALTAEMKRRGIGWKEVGALQASLGLGTGKALDLDEESMTKLVEEIGKLEEKA